MGTLVEDILDAAEWISMALQSDGYRADFSPDSLHEIDRFMDEHSQDGRATPGGRLAGAEGSRLFAIGGYIGEVARRALGGQWVADDADPEGEINIELHLADGSMVWPVQRAMKRFRNGAEDSVAAWGLGIGMQPGPPPAR